MLKRIKLLPFMNTTLKSRVFFSMILFTVIPFVIVVVITSIFMTGNAVSRYKEDISKSLAVSIENINEKINRFILKSSYLSTNQYIIKNIKQEFDNLDQMITFSNMLGNIIGEPYDFGQKRPYTIYSSNRTIYDSKFIEYIGAVIDNPWLEEAASAPTTEIIWVPSLTEKSGRSYITFYRSIVEFRSFLGVLEVNIPFESLLPDIKNIHLPESARIFL